MNRKTAVYYDPIFLAHDTGAHPENSNRLRVIVDALKNAPFKEKLVWPSFSPALIEQVELVHGSDYLTRTKDFVNSGEKYLDADTIVSAQSWEAAMMAAGAVISATESVISGEHRNAFCAVRPPGHHAEKNRSMGFCLINNVAVAAKVAIDLLGLSKVAIIDFDVHHGNGTQNSFYNDPDIFYISTHQSPLYPGSGAKEEVGAGAGIGTTLNFPLSAGAGDHEFIEVFSNTIAPTLIKYSPELIFISAGFDAHRDDPLANLTLSDDGYVRITSILKEVADDICQGRVVSTLEGGYNLDALALAVTAHLSVLAQ